MSPPDRHVRKVPTDARFVLRPGRVGWAIHLLVGLLPLTVVVASVLPTAEASYIRPALSVLFGATGLVALMAGLTGWWASTRPRLAADEQGIWVRTRVWPARVVHLPWDEVARVEKARGSANPFGYQWRSAIAVVPAGHSAHQEPGRPATSPHPPSRPNDGRVLVAPIPFGVRSSTVLDALADLADGRSAQGLVAGGANSAPSPHPTPDPDASSGGPPTDPAHPARFAEAPPAGLPLSLLANRRQLVTIAAACCGVAVVALDALVFFSSRGSVPAMLFGIGVCTLVGAVVLAMLLRTAWYAGPVFAADHDGIWISPPAIAPGRRRHVYLPWEAIATIKILPFTSALALTVERRTDRLAPQARVTTTADVALAEQVRSGLSVDALPGERSVAEVTAVLVSLAGDRCEVSVDQPSGRYRSVRNRSASPR